MRIPDLDRILVRDAEDLRRHLRSQFFRGPSAAGGRFRRTETGLRRSADRRAHAVSDGANRAHPDAGKSPPDLRLSDRRLCDCSYSLGRRSALSRQYFPAAGTFLHRPAQAARRDSDGHELGVAADLSRRSRRKRPAWSWSPARPAAARRPRWPRCSTRSTTTQPVHIVTLEDPIEFVHPTRKATFNQRELGHDFNNYPNGLRAALAPGAEGHSRRRNARSRHGGSRADGGGNRPPRAEHAAHGRCRPVDQPYSRSLFARRRTAAAHPPGRYPALHRQPATRAQSRRRPAVADGNPGPQSAHARKRSRSAKASIAASTKSSRRARPSAG